MSNASFDPKLDLKLERTLDVAPELVWAAWTTPKHIEQFFTPKPWTASGCRIDLRPGGEFFCMMHGPDGEEFPVRQCYLEVVPNHKLVITDALQPGYRPAPEPFMTATILIEPAGKGSKYTAIACHNSEASRKKHEEMGFHEGWGTVADQLVAYMKSL
jgi:uncharacterized protein YndB with AHSA1/START domain